MRAANADVLPFEFTNYTDTIGIYVSEVAKLTNDMREEAKERNWRLDNGIFSAVFDPTKPYILPKTAEPIPDLDFGPLNRAFARLQESTRNYQEALVQRGIPRDIKQRQQLDEILMNVERAMTRKEGLPRRPWYKHQIYAPGFYTGYGVKTLPAVRESIEQHNWKEAKEQIAIVAKTIENVAAEIEKAATILQ
jgi:N-acetylated-alpha-linked acidic dipeptidase